MNNKLRNQRCYLAGAIDRVPDRGREWRSFITPVLKNIGIKVINPLKKPTDLGTEDSVVALKKAYLKKNKKYDDLSLIMKEIRSVDLRMVDISDFMVVHLDLDTHPCGTMEEIFWANRQKKPILIRVKQGKINAPDWLFGTIPHQFIFSEWNDLISYLSNIDTGLETNYFNRWCFLSNI
jgi:hypothetical protein